MNEALEALTPREEEKVHEPTDKWSDSFAAKIAVQDFNAAENYRSSNCDHRWSTHNELYLAWVQQKYWEGTKMARASLSVHVAFEQVESMLPKIMSALFADDPWFQAGRSGETTALQAADWRDMMIDQLDRTKIREVVRLCAKSALIHGDGIMKMSWHLQEVERLAWLPKMQPEMQDFLNPLAGMQSRNASYKRVLDKQTVKYMDNRPELEWIPLEDFYIDPNCPSPDPQAARFCVQRKLATVDDLDALREMEPWKIPSTGQLIDWSQSKASTQGDVTKGSIESFRQGYWNPGMDTTADPGGKMIEILEYCTNDRLVVVANRDTAILNMPNSYGFKPYYHAWYGDVLRRFYSQGVCDIVESEQRLQTALLNGRLDELALSLHRPMVKKLGIKVPTYALRSRPGQIWEAENPREDVVFMDVPNITQSAYIETSASELRVQKVTGQNDLYSSGTPSSGGNSASRTATGIGAQVQASGSRIQYIVENLQDSFLEPMLNHLVTLNHMFPPIGTERGDTIAMTHVQVWMRAAARMKSQSALMQTFPMLFQAVMTPGITAELALTGETVNWRELFRVIGDMTGYKEYADLIRKMTPEEQQARNQPPAEAMLKAQMQDKRIEGQRAIQAERLGVESELEREKQASTDQTEDNHLLAELSRSLMQVISAKDKEKKAD